MTDMYRTAAAIAAKYENKEIEADSPYANWPKYGDLVEFNDRFNGRVYQGIFIEYAHEYGPTYQHNRRAMLFYDDILYVKDVLTFTPEEYLGVIVSRNDWIEQMCTKKTMDEMSDYIHMLGINRELTEDMLIRMIKCYRRKLI